MLFLCQIMSIQHFPKNDRAKFPITAQSQTLLVSAERQPNAERGQNKDRIERCDPFPLLTLKNRTATGSFYKSNKAQSLLSHHCVWIRFLR